MPSEVLKYSTEYYKRSLGREACPISYDRKNTLKCESILTGYSMIAPNKLNKKTKEFYCNMFGISASYV